MGIQTAQKIELRIQLHLLNISLMKKFILRGVTKPHIKRIFRKETTKRPNLKNIANKSGKIEYKKRKGCKNIRSKGFLAFL